MDTIFLIGRILFAGFFLYNAYKHLVNNSGMVGYAQSKGVPMAKYAVIFSGLLILFGGYSMLTGVRVTAGVVAIALFLIPVTFMMHAFWKETDPMARNMQKIQFMKNIALLGAALMMLAIPTPWAFSL